MARKNVTPEAQERIRRVQELRRSSAASPVKRGLPRGADRRRAIREAS